MERMENANFDETNPTSISDNPEDQLDLGATLPTAINHEPIGQPGLGETIPTSIKLEGEIPPGFEATIPPPPEQGALGSTGGDTIPPPPEQGALGSTGGDNLPPIFANDHSTPRRKRFSLRLLIPLGILGLILIGVLSAFAGYQRGLTIRSWALSTQEAAGAKEQFDLAVQDVQNKEYARARQRLEYIIKLDPNYPGVTEKLAEVLLQMSITATPTFTPTPTLTPTPDTRGVEELFSQAQQSLYNGDWTSAINTLFSLRKADINYKTVLVDDMFYAAYRNSGKDKILKNGDLEGGIYDLTLAQRFGPLDADSKSYLTWARLYILGASYWDVDWGQAVYYFAQVAPALPNLHDSTGWTATQRYKLALVGYGDSLIVHKEWCAAAKQYEQALAYGGDANVQQAYNNALQKCEGPKPTQTTESGEPAPTETPAS
jgi:hypothetical protein